MKSAGLCHKIIYNSALLLMNGRKGCFYPSPIITCLEYLLDRLPKVPAGLVAGAKPSVTAGGICGGGLFSSASVGGGAKFSSSYTTVHSNTIKQ